jgi:hypothetical protein
VLIASVSRYDVLTQLGLRLAVGGKAFAQGLPKTFTMHGERMTTSRAGRTRWSYTICWRGMGWTRGCSIQGHGSPLHQMEEPIASMMGSFLRRRLGGRGKGALPGFFYRSSGILPRLRVLALVFQVRIEASLEERIFTPDSPSLDICPTLPGGQTGISH